MLDFISLMYVRLVKLDFNSLLMPSLEQQHQKTKLKFFTYNMLISTGHL
jgi:hypothetical protein